MSEEQEKRELRQCMKENIRFGNKEIPVFIGIFLDYRGKYLFSCPFDSFPPSNYRVPIIKKHLTCVFETDSTKRFSPEFIDFELVTPRGNNLFIFLEYRQ